MQICEARQGIAGNLREPEAQAAPGVGDSQGVLPAFSIRALVKGPLGLSDLEVFYGTHSRG